MTEGSEMIKRVFAVVMACLFLSGGMAFAGPCTGVTEATLGNHDEFSFCFDPNPVIDDVQHYVLYRDGVVIEVIPLSMCDAERCDTPTYLERQKGTYSYTLIAVDTEDLQSDHSDPVLVTVVNTPPGKPVNFKKRGN